jgi:hypothetical protein
MRYKEYIHKFLQMSLMVYLHYHHEINNIRKEYKSERDSSDSSDSLESIKEENSDNESEKNSKKFIDNDVVRLNKKSTVKFQRNGSKKNSVHSDKGIDPDFEVNKHMDKIKEELYNKFASKIEKIIKYFEDKNMQRSDKRLEKPLFILKRLKEIKEVNDRNELIEELELSVSNLLV